MNGPFKQNGTIEMHLGFIKKNGPLREKTVLKLQYFTVNLIHTNLSIHIHTNQSMKNTLNGSKIIGIKECSYFVLFIPSKNLIKSILINAWLSGIFSVYYMYMMMIRKFIISFFLFTFFLSSYFNNERIHYEN